MNVPQWLQALGLARYAKAFADHDVDGHTLPWLTEADLAVIGVTSVGHRRKLLDAIAKLEKRSMAPAEPAPATAPSCAEQRRLSVLSCDMVGATTLSQPLGTEELRDAVRAFHTALKRIVAEYDGHVANFIGDCVLAYFGWPRAHEDDAERAVRAGLSMVQVARGLETAAGATLAVRVGVATGPVLVGDLFPEGPTQGHAAVGAVPELANRLQALGAPAQVVIDEPTRALLAANFALQPLPPHTLEGLAQPLVAAWAVSGERPVDSRFDARKGRELPPMIGRDQELALLQGRWARAQEGEGQVVLLVGEAGIGKSRLTRALLDEGIGQPHERIRWQCSPYHTGSALWPVIQWLRLSAGLLVDDVTDTALMAPQTPRERTLDALVEQLFETAKPGALLLVVEDAHWIDPTTLELLKRALEEIDGRRLLILITSRPEKQPKLPEHTSLTRLSLNRLNRASVETIVARLGGNGLQAHTRATIVAQSDGVPLFAEELTKAVLETGEAAIPASLQGSLMARLDHIAEAKEVAQIAACIGREFDPALVRSVAERPDSVASALDGLAAAELVFRRGRKDDPHFTFKHALVQEAAYESLPHSKRRHLHARILEVLEARRAETPPEMLAHHAAGANLADKAIGYWRQAGDAAIAKSAYVEAAVYFERAIRQIDARPDHKNCRHLELELQLGLARAHVAVHGHAAEATGAAFQRAEELLDDDRMKRFNVDFGLWAWHAMRGHLAEAHPRTTRMLAASVADARNETKLFAHGVAGTSHLLLGELGMARDHLERASALHDPAKPGQAATWLPMDVGAACHSRYFLAWTLCMQGFAEQSSALQEHAHRITPALPQARARADMHLICGLCAACARDVATARTNAQALAEVASKHLLAEYASHASGLLAWVAMESGRPAEAVAAFEASNALPSGASRVYSVFLAAGHAAALAAVGRHEEALCTIERAIHESDRMAQGWCDAELWRVRGELLLGGPQRDHAQASRCFERALAIARRRTARLWELRAATSRARLWAHQGEVAEALDLLAGTYDGFTEGFNTTDLVEARALISELAHPVGR